MPEFSEQYEIAQKSSQEEMENLVEFFELLFEIDMRVNPNLYFANNSQNNCLINETMDKSGQ